MSAPLLLPITLGAVLKTTTARCSQSSQARIHTRSFLNIPGHDLRVSNHPPRPFVRLASTQTHPSTHSQNLSPEREVAYTRLRPVLDHLPAVDWAVAYGSGVIHQANKSPTAPRPMIDFLVATSSPIPFHTSNLTRNSSHYPFWARMAGSSVITSVQENLGAGVWYVTMVDINGLEVKYGVISTDRLIRDLRDWETLYAAGRLHKPVLPLMTTPDISSATESNLHSALSLSLLLLPHRQPFTEFQLWEQIAGLSYSGDPRMSVPGAENPQKVRNIVRGQGNLQGFRTLYDRAIKTTKGLRWEGTEKWEEKWEWRGHGDEMMIRPNSTSYYASLLSTLPMTLRHRVAKHVDPTITNELLRPQSTTSMIKVTDITTKKEFWEDVVKRSNPRQILLQELRSIIHRPALAQSAKGLLTAGFRKSARYSFAKFRKWLESRANT